MPSAKTDSFRSALVLLALLAVSCIPLAATLQTDAELYDPGDSGVAVVESTRSTIFLPGCPALSFEEMVDGQWVQNGVTLACFWEGLATPLEVGEQFEYDFYAPAPGTWRLRGSYGVGCDPTLPLNEENCSSVRTLVSNTFEVDNPCMVTGCSNEICAPSPVPSPCVYLPHYVCLDVANCGPFGPFDTCAWEDTPELQECLEQF